MEKDITVETLKGKRMEKAIAVSAGLFLKEGIDSVKMTDIADATGVGVATLYRYFGTKTGIAIAAMTYLWNELGSMFSGVFESDVFRRQNGLKQLAILTYNSPYGLDSPTAANLLTSIALSPDEATLAIGGGDRLGSVHMIKL